MADVQLTRHFTLGELGGIGAGRIIEDALRGTAELLETVRAVLGAPLKVTSGYRSVERNRAVGGAPDSQHVDGTAADVLPLGVSLFTAYGKLSQAIAGGQLTVGQLILYPVEGHIHVSQATRGSRNSVLIKVGKEYKSPTAELLAGLPGAPTGAGNVLAVLIALGLVIGFVSDKKGKR